MTSGLKITLGNSTDWQKIMHIFRNALKGRNCLKDLFIQHSVTSGTTENMGNVTKQHDCLILDIS